MCFFMIKFISQQLKMGYFMGSDSSFPLILILGSQGNLGSQLVREFQANSYKNVIAWTRNDCDLAITSDLNLAIRKVCPSIVINTVAYNDVDSCELNLSEQRKAIKLNVNLVECLAQTCLDINAKLIQFSSNYVFSGDKLSYTEFDKVDPINFYGMTKQLSEEAVLSRLDKGLNGSIVRISNLFGSRGIGMSSKPSFFDLISKAAMERNCLNIVNDEINCFTYVKDVAHKVYEILFNKDFLGVYHLANSDALTWYEAAQIYFELQGKTISLQPVNAESFKRTAKRPQSAILQVTKLPTMRAFKVAMAEYINEYHSMHKKCGSV